MLTIACVMRSGGDFSVDWVAKLEAACYKNIRPAHRFSCLTDIADKIPRSLVIDWIPLEHNWPGWWSKIELFRPGIFPAGQPVLFFDLDTLIVRDIEHLERAIGDQLVLLRDFYRPENGWGTGVMGWTAGEFTEIYDEFKLEAQMLMRKYRSDQDFIRWFLHESAVRFWQDEFPSHVVSYKVHCERGLPGNAHVVCFHGKPRPYEAAQWAQERWKE